MNGDCTAEAAAYAAAYVDYQNAAQIAENLYNAWYECEYGNGGQRPTNFANDSGESILK